MIFAKKTALAGLCALAAFSAAASSASATPLLAMKLQSAGVTVDKTGSSPLTYSGSIGSFTTTVNTGTTTITPAALDLSSVEISSSAGGTLVVSLSATGFTTALGAHNWLTQFSGNFVSGSASVELQTYLDSSDKLFGTGTPLSDLTDTSTPFALSAVAPASTTGLFAFTEVLTITTRGAAHVSLDGSITDAPEPASLALLGVGMIGIAAVGRGKLSKTAKLS